MPLFKNLFKNVSPEPYQCVRLFKQVDFNKGRTKTAMSVFLTRVHWTWTMCAQWAEKKRWQHITGGCIPGVLKMSLCCYWGQLSCWWLKWKRIKPCSSTAGTFKYEIFDSSITFTYFTLLPPPPQHTDTHTGQVHTVYSESTQESES